jgi:integrase
MNRWRIIIRGGDGPDRELRINAPSAAAAKRAERVRAALAARAESSVASVARVVPGVVWREPWGYYWQCRRNGRRYLHALDTRDLAEAIARAAVKRAALESALKTGRWAALDRTRARPACCSFSMLADAYRREMEQAGTCSSTTLRERTFVFWRVVAGMGYSPETEARLLNGAAAKAYQARMLDQIAALEQRDPQAANRRRRTVAHELAVVRMFVSERLADEYVAAGLECPLEAWAEFRRRSRMRVRREGWSRPAAAALAQLEAAARVLQSSGPRELWLIWICARCLCMRAVEIASMRWGWIEAHAGRRMLGVISRPDEGFEPKASAGWVAIEPEVLAELDRIRGAAPATEYVLGGPSFAWRYNRVQRQFAAWAKANGLAGRLHRAHDLRAITSDEVAQDPQWGAWVADRLLRHAGQSVGDRHYRELTMPAQFPGVGLFGWRANTEHHAPSGV